MEAISMNRGHNSTRRRPKRDDIMKFAAEKRNKSEILGGPALDSLAQESPAWRLLRKQTSSCNRPSSCNRVHSSGGSDDSFWIFAVSAPSGRNALILADSGPLGPAKGGMLYDAQGHD